MTACPYCSRSMGAMALREHVALNTCGKVPAGAAVPFLRAEADATAEDDYRKMAERVGRASGWLVNHVERARMGQDGRWTTPCVAGFPDSWFLHPDGRLLVVEFKTQSARRGGDRADRQRAWLDAIAAIPTGRKVMWATPLGWPHLQAALTEPWDLTPRPLTC